MGGGGVRVLNWAAWAPTSASVRAALISSDVYTGLQQDFVRRIQQLTNV